MIWQTIKNLSLLSATILFLVPSQSLAHAQNVTDESRLRVAVRLTSDRIQIAEPVDVIVTVRAAEGIQVRFPEPPEQLGPFDVVDVQDEMDLPTPSGRTWRRRYTLESIRAGDFIVPEIEIAFTDSKLAPASIQRTSTAAQSITVVSALEEETAPTEFEDIKPVVFLQEPDTFSIRDALLPGVVILSLIAVLGAGYFVWKRQPSPPAPGVWARDSIRRIESAIDAEENPSMIHNHLAGIMREYVDRRFGIAAPKLTSQEFLDQLRSSEPFSDEVRDTADRFLATADAIKFAGASASRDQAAGAFQLARKFVDDCEALADRQDDKPVSSTRRSEGT